MKIYCDLHIHSCLSPCGDDDMTPNNIVNMARLKGLNCIALTDHNSCGNCRATQLAARQAGIGFIPGMEINTSEDIHAVCLFPDCDSAEAFSAEIYRLLPNTKNKPEVFGRQLYTDWLDNPAGEEEKLLINAAALSITQVPALVKQHGGFGAGRVPFFLHGGHPPLPARKPAGCGSSPAELPGGGILRRPLSVGYCRGRPGVYPHRG